MKKTLFTKYTLSLFIPLLFFLFFFIQSNKLSFIQDDTYISIRYAQNFADGKGLVFNLNEKTEGFTSFLWVIILSLVYKLNISPEQFSVTASSIFGVLAILLSYLLCRLFLSKFYPNDTGEDRFLFSDLIPLIVFPLYAFNTAFIYWSVSGMEETLFMFLLILSFYFFIKEINQKRFYYPFIFSGILTCLTRPEGFLLIPFLVLVKFIVLKKQRGPVLNGAILTELGWLIMPLSCFILFRLFYYGYPLPNTFYAKSGFTLFHLKRGFSYLFSFLITNMFYGTVLFVPLIISIIYKEKKLIYLLLFSISFCLLIAIIGGDVLPLHRLFFPVLPLIYLSFVISMVLLFRRTFNKPSAIIFCLILTAAVCYNSFSAEKETAIEKRAFETGLVAKMKIYAGWLKQKQIDTGKDVTVAVSTIGAISYYSGVNVIDLAGLTDKYTAHFPKETEGITDSLPVLWKERTYNAEYVLSREPDYIIFPAGAKPSAFPECALFVQKEFYNSYFTQLIYSDELNMYLPVFSRRSDKLERGTSSDCDNSFVANYINASNLFLHITSSNYKTVIKDIELEINEMIAKCPDRKGEAVALLGFAYYHIKQFDYAGDLLKESLACDSLNSSSLLYLRNISLIKKDTLSALKYLMKLKRISPDAMPTLSN